MKIYHFKLALTGLAALLLSACASLPEQLTSQSESVVTDYTIWTQADPAQKGEVRLGGVIASTKNLTDKTRLEIVNLPIDDAGTAKLNQRTAGALCRLRERFPGSGHIRRRPPDHAGRYNG